MSYAFYKSSYFLSYSMLLYDGLQLPVVVAKLVRSLRLISIAFV